MTEICDIIDAHVSDSSDDSVFNLAQAYEAKFSQTPFIEETADDFQSARHGETVMINKI